MVIKWVLSDDNTLSYLGPNRNEKSGRLNASDVIEEIVWSANGVVNGDATSGTVTPGAQGSAIFKAPEKVPGQNPVTVSAQVNTRKGFTYEGKGFDKMMLLAYVKITDKEKFKLDLRVTEPTPGLLVYTDSATMTVQINADGTVDILDVQNFNPKVVPESFTADGCTISWVHDAIGEVNITSATGITTGTDPILILNFNHSGTMFPTFKSDCSGIVEIKDGFPILGSPSSLTFTLDHTSPSFEIDDGHVYAKLTRVQ